MFRTDRGTVVAACLMSALGCLMACALLGFPATGGVRFAWVLRWATASVAGMRFLRVQDRRAKACFGTFGALFVLALALGYRINIDRDSREFSSETFDSMVKNAKENVQHTVSSFAQQFSQNGGKSQEHSQEEPKDRPTPPPRTESAASGTRPVNVQFPDGGSVDVRDDGDGYHEADIR